MSWRCEWCYSMNLPDTATYCPHCGRDIQVYERKGEGE